MRKIIAQGSNTPQNQMHPESSWYDGRMTHHQMLLPYPVIEDSDYDENTC